MNSHPLSSFCNYDCLERMRIGLDPLNKYALLKTQSLNRLEI